MIASQTVSWNTTLGGLLGLFKSKSRYQSLGMNVGWVKSLLVALEIKTSERVEGGSN